jgi:hypothetical protein
LGRAATAVGNIGVSGSLVISVLMEPSGPTKVRPKPDSLTVCLSPES